MEAAGSWQPQFTVSLILTACIQCICERRQKTAPLEAVFGVLSTAPQHVSLTTLNSFCALAPSFDDFQSPLREGCFLTFFPLPTCYEATYFGSSTSEPQIDFSQSLAGHASQCI
jgi:hypothetical protein